MKIEFQKIVNLPHTTSDDKNLLKNKSKFMINKKKITVLTKKLGLNTNA